MGVAVPPDSEFDIKCPSLCPRILISSHGDCPTVLILRVVVESNQIKQSNRMNRIYNLQVNRASHACGPLVKWALAQFQYADMLKRVEPLRNELRDLEVCNIRFAT